MPLDIHTANPNNNLVYVTHEPSDTVSVINNTTNELVTDNITVGEAPTAIAVNPNNDLVYVSNNDYDISLINRPTNEVLPNSITVGFRPRDIAVNPNNNLVILTNPIEFPYW